MGNSKNVDSDLIEIYGYTLKTRIISKVIPCTWDDITPPTENYNPDKDPIIVYSSPRVEWWGIKYKKEGEERNSITQPKRCFDKFLREYVRSKELKKRLLREFL